MRVLLVDQDSALLTAITQSLGRYCAIDAVTTKADCLDLLRANEFEVIVAGERLEDGSGLELLGQLGKHRPGMLRIFAAERERLKLLQGRLGPFGLFRTLSYPIEARQLLAALSAAGAPNDAADDMADIQQGDGVEESPPAPAPVRPTAPTRRAMSPSSQSRSAAYGVTPPSRTSGEPASRLRAAARPERDSLSEASRMAMAARSRHPRLTEDTGTKRRAFLVGASVVLVLGVMEIAFKLFKPSAESSPAATGVSVVRTPHYSAEVIKLVAETETALQQDDFRRARADVQTLHQIAPNHPRLSFFESLLRRHGDSSAAAPIVTSARPERGTQRRASAATSASPPREPAHVRNATPLLRKSRPADGANGANGSNTLSAARASTTTAMDGQGTQPAPASAHTPGFDEATRPAPAPAATAATAASAPGPSSHGTFPGKTLEDSNGGIISQHSVTPSQATATPAPRFDASPPVTREARLVKHVSAEYPPSAANRGIEGVVDVAVTVSSDGSVSDVTVVHSDPPDVFNHSALTAVRRWKYEPKTVNGAPVAAHVQLRLQFKLDQHEP